MATLFAASATLLAQSWQPVVNLGPPEAGLPLLLTDGSVLVHQPSSNVWWKLKPNNQGDYVHGAWSKIASMPSNYGPLYFSSAVLKDGRVLVIGGEYIFGIPIWSNLGAIYNPVTNVWKPLAAPAGWANIGDAQCAVLPNGKFLLASPFDKRMASFDPATDTWTAVNGAGKLDRFDEENWTLLKDGTILTVDAENAPTSERFLPTLSRWISAGSTPVLLTDEDSEEIGPQVLMPNGKVFATGATGHNAVYTPGSALLDPGSWVAAPDFPMVGGQLLAIADGPACLLPNGNVLCGASPGVFQSDTRFFEFNGTSLVSVPATPNSPGNSCFQGNMLMLPTGQVLYTDFSDDVEIYTPTGSPLSSWRPTITNPPSTLFLGQSFTLTGTQLNGLSQCCAYGDDSSNATNYPLVRLRFTNTGHVVFCKTLNHSTMAVATGTTPVSTTVQVPGTSEIGPATMTVVTNGIASNSINVSVVSVNLAPISITRLEGSSSSGTLANILASDNSYYIISSALVASLGQVATAEVTFSLPSNNVSALAFSFESSAETRVTALYFVYNWTTGRYDNFGATPQTATDTVTSFSVLSPAKYISPLNIVKIAIRGLMPNGATAPRPFIFKLDQVKLSL